ncbi:MAG: hypothetical protein A2Y40_06760 [Candidatus Margulisbacteria bacterium GWF2_35_9]|nr:MAG: hypothetical protein A2Y40_06760 [Candidatus Margulisbacteria bacterium GWF2_35_9]
MKKRLAFYKDLLKKIINLLEDSFSVQKQNFPAKNEKIVKSIVSTKLKKADIQFVVKQKNPQLFEVTLKDFSGLLGVGVTPEQALEDLIHNMNEKIDTLVKSTLTSALHIDEIQSKFKISMDKLIKDQDSTETVKKPNFLNKLFQKKKPTAKSYEINIFLKKPFSTESILEKIIKKDIAQMNLARIPYPRVSNKHAQLPLSLDNRIFLKANTNNEEIPIHLLMDDEGNSLDDDFSFGIVVNLN